MSGVDTGGPAFPTSTQITQDASTGHTVTHQYLSDGMTLRDYIAIHADKDDVNAPTSIEGCAAVLGVDQKDYDGRIDYPKVVIKCRYAYADAWLKERNQ